MRHKTVETCGAFSGPSSVIRLAKALNPSGPERGPPFFLHMELEQTQAVPACGNLSHGTAETSARC